MLFVKEPNKPIITNLDFIADDNIDYNDLKLKTIPKYFNPEFDIIDNACKLFDLGDYGFNMCIDGLFTLEASNIIEKTYKDSLEEK